MGHIDPAGNFKGTRCQICTGCGRCADTYGAEGVRSAMKVVTSPGLPAVGSGFTAYPGERLAVVDVGTTTIAMQLFTTEGKVCAEYVNVNPQVAYGADVLSRIQAAADPELAARMCKMARGELENGLARFREELLPGERMRVILAGNTTMIYLLCGDDPAQLGRAPFTVSHAAERRWEIGGVPCYIFPCLSAFVGGDIVAGMYACGMAEREPITLLIDLGTNGEMALGNRKRGIACATAAGPAFEGGANKGIWGADMVHLLARLRTAGIVDETGLLLEKYFDEGILIGDVRVTQAAIRAIQLAKAAIRAGIDILMQEYGIAGEWSLVDRVVLAGGFGYHLNPGDAAVIGLLPGELTDRTLSGGNTALAGALRMGEKALGKESVPEEILRTEILNLAKCPDFEERYLEYINME